MTSDKRRVTREGGRGDSWIPGLGCNDDLHGESHLFSHLHGAWCVVLWLFYLKFKLRPLDTSLIRLLRTCRRLKQQPSLDYPESLLQ